MCEIKDPNSLVNLGKTNEMSIQVDSDGLFEFYRNSQVHQIKPLNFKQKSSLTYRKPSRNTQSLKNLKHPGHTNSHHYEESIEEFRKVKGLSPKIQKYLESKTKSNNYISRTQMNSIRDSLIKNDSKNLDSLKCFPKCKTIEKVTPVYKVPPVVDPLVNFSKKLEVKPLFNTKKSIANKKRILLNASNSKKKIPNDQGLKIINLNGFKLNFFGL
ncbi:hypothetical protein SteCoe_2055 [Stentor coeruleus]|uniref:Uncharacterized protein n=1 Tax=Stentor coeruleus TaxID=5963 RepID=A0A1R2D0E9_9CILI|nr:hypothetical protein SteCoe_2055 [Stentor coeruleus]